MLWFGLTFVLEVVSVVLFGVVLKLGIHDIISPAHHLGVLDSAFDTWEAHLEVVTLGVEAVVGAGGPLHQRRLKSTLRIKLNDPILTHSLISCMIMHMLLLRHINTRDLVLITSKIGPRVRRDHTTATTLDTGMRSHGHANLLSVTFVMEIVRVRLDCHALDGAVFEFVTVGLVGGDCGERIIRQLLLKGSDTTLPNLAQRRNCLLLRHLFFDFLICKFN